VTLNGLLAIVGIIIALYALARPIQQQSVKLFVPYRWIAVGLGISGLVLLALEALALWEIDVGPWVSFSMQVAALATPVGVALWAVRRWRRAELTAEKDGRFKGFILTSLRENSFDELVRILEQNEGRLPEVLSAETAFLLFDRRLIRALIAERSWLHLWLLSNATLRKRLPDPRVAVDWTIRELLASEGTPLHAMVAAAEGSDESAYWSCEESDLIEWTFLDPDWYLSCHPAHPALMVVMEILDSGRLDDAYNRNDRLYIARQGVSSRSLCPIHLTQKMIKLAVRQAVLQRKDGDFCVDDLADIFGALYDHSHSDPTAWETEHLECHEFPTPFAYLMSGICSDLSFLSEEAMRQADGGCQPPNKVAKFIGFSWTRCMMDLLDGDDHVPDSFRVRLLREYLAYLLKVKDASDDRRRPTPAPLPEWYEVQLTPFKQMCGSRDAERQDFLKRVVHGMDMGKPYINAWQGWLCSELGLPRRTRGR